MQRGKYQNITQKSKIRKEILELRSQGISDEEIARIISEKSNQIISKKTIQSIKQIKRKSVYAEYRQLTKSYIFSYILELKNHILYYTQLTQMRKEVSELVLDKFPQPFSLFSQRTHQRCVKGIIKKIKSFQNNQSLKLTKIDSEFYNNCFETQSEQFSNLSPFQYSENFVQSNSYQEQQYYNY